MRPEVVFLCLFCLVGCSEPSFEEPKTNVRNPAPIPYRITAGEKPNEYRVELLPPDKSYPLSGYTILKDSKDFKQKTFVKSVSDAGSMIDEEVVGGESYSYSLYIEGDEEPAFKSVIQVPKDIVFKGPKYLSNETKSKKLGRLYFYPGGLLYTRGEETKLDVDAIIVSPDKGNEVSIRSFSRIGTAKKFSDGRTPGKIELRTKNLIGRLLIQNVGEAGGEGLKGTRGVRGLTGSRYQNIRFAGTDAFHFCRPETLMDWQIIPGRSREEIWKEYHPYRGGRGGVGQEGEPGYVGMRGGDGGRVELAVPAEFLKNIEIDVSGGDRGLGGEGGDGGPGGFGGEGVWSWGNICKPEIPSSCCLKPPEGLEGEQGPLGKRGPFGESGKSGSVVLNGVLQ